MKTVVWLSFFGAGALAHPSGLWWGTDECFPSPENTDNQCAEPQQAGFDWSDLGEGDDWAFEGFNFGGFSPSDSCGNSGGKCIQARLSQDDNYAIKVEATQAPFSVTNLRMSTSRDTMVNLNYEMADGSICRQQAWSTPNGIDVTNDQCGDAVAVQFALPEDSQFGECDMSIHKMDFDCSTGPKPPTEIPPHSSYTHSEPSSTSTPSTEWTQPTHSHTQPVESWPTPETTTMIPPESWTTSTVWTTDTITVTSCAPTVTNCPAHSTTVVTTTYIASTTVCPPSPSTSQGTATPPASTTCSTASTSTSSTSCTTSTSTSTSSTSCTTSTSTSTSTTSCTSSTPSPWSTSSTSSTSCTSSGPITSPEWHTSFTMPTSPSTSEGPSASTVMTTLPIPSPSVVPAPCPELVPKCLNTWLSVPKCDSNSDAACFCPSSEFTEKVTTCIYAWGHSQKEIDSALSYFAGICAPYVPSNPEIIDIVPPSSTSSHEVPHHSATAPVSEMTSPPEKVTAPVPPMTSPPEQIHTSVGDMTSPVEAITSAPVAPDTPCTTMTWSSHTVTVPLVQFSTIPVGTTSSVALVPGTTHGAHATTSHRTCSTSTFTTSTVSQTTTCTTHGQKPTSTVSLSNDGSRVSFSSIWTFGAFCAIMWL